MRRSMMMLLLMLSFVSGAMVADVANAQNAVVPVRDLGSVVARTRDSLGLVFGVWEFTNGRVLVNDGLRRRLVLYDTLLASPVIVADTTGSAPMAYGRVPTPLVPFGRDSVLFVDLASQSLLVIGSAGTVARVVAAPKPADLVHIRSSATGADPMGRLVYRGLLAYPRRMPGQPPPVRIDSAPVVRADFATRTVDTVALFKVPGGFAWTPIRTPEDKVMFKSVVAPVQWVDDWALHADGSIAILRGIDYHIDWIAPDGTRTSSPRMAFDWRRLTDADKQRLADSVLAAWDSLPEAARSLTMGEAQSAGVSPDQLVTKRLSNGTVVVPLAREVVPLADIPDYVPPIRPGAMRADLDGNLWILPATSARSRNGGLVYDVVNRAGELHERVELPAGRSIAGFGRGGIVYLMSGDRATGFVLERARVR